jgi:hypothetical protein
MSLEIKGSVGSGCTNDKADVIVVQELLNHHIAFGLLTDTKALKLTGKADTPTVRAIKRFQERGVILKPDGKIGPAGPTWQHLVNPPNSLRIQSEAIGLSALGRFFGPVGTINPEAWNVALESLSDHAGDRRLRSGRLLTLIDFRIPQNSERLWVVNLAERRILHHALVCHGAGSGATAIPKSFSNQGGTKQSCVGAFITRHSWPSTLGKVSGRAMGLWGLDKTNSNAQSRGIHFHGATYVKPGGVSQSWGCFGTMASVNETLVDLLQRGHFVYAYGGKSWM